MGVGGSCELCLLSLQLNELHNNLLTYKDECTTYIFVAGHSDKNKKMAWLPTKDVPDL